jgi:hypothetical protein
VDGEVDTGDVQTMISDLFRTAPGDFNVDGKVDAADYVVWRKSDGAATAMFTEGDGDLDGDVDDADFNLWRSNYGFVRQPLSPNAGSGSGTAAVPEPSAAALLLVGLCVLVSRLKRRGN